MSRLDPANWTSRMALVVLVVWLAYAVASTVWLHPLLWTVLPSGLALYLFAERYPWRVILLVVAPLTLLTAASQVVAIWLDAPTEISFAIYLVACAYFSLVVTHPSRDRLVADLPRPLLGKPFAARLAWARFEESVVAANDVVRRINAGEDRSSGRTEIDRLATEARHEADRGGPWKEAWAAHAGWLDALGELVDTGPTTDRLRRINDLLAESNRAQMLAIEQTDVDRGAAGISD